VIISLASERQLEHWDSFVDCSVNGTIFNKRRFLAYHGDKFKDGEQFLVIMNGAETYAQITLYTYLDEQGIKVCKSPYGASYGGFVFKSIPSYKSGKEVVKIFLNYLRDNKIHQCFLRQPAGIFCTQNMDTFIFNLLEAGFISHNREVFNYMDIAGGCPVIEAIHNTACRTKIRKAMKSGIIIDQNAPLDDAWLLIQRTIRRFGKEPTHNRDELKTLMDSFPESIRFTVAYHEGIPIASVTGIALNKTVNSSFYLSTDERYLELRALRYTLERAIQQAQNSGFKLYDFGTSSTMLTAGPGIFAFKEEFSRSGMFRETLKWERK
jgi:hypothetical protein